MIIICPGWYGKHADERIIGRKEPDDDAVKSHGICGECASAIREAIGRLVHEEN